MRAIAILILLTSISTFSAQKTAQKTAQKFTILPDSFLDELVTSDTKFFDKKAILLGLKTQWGATILPGYVSYLKGGIQKNRFNPEPEKYGGDTFVRGTYILKGAYRRSRDQALDFIDLVLRGLMKKQHEVPTYLIWQFLYRAVTGIQKYNMKMEDIRQAYADGTWEVSEKMWKILGLEKIEEPSTVEPTTEAIVTSTDASASTDDPSGSHRGAGSGQESTYPPIDPNILASIKTAGGHGIPPSTLPDGTPLSSLPDEYAVYKGVDEWSRIVANRHGYFVIHPVQSNKGEIMFDPYTIGQVMGYIYEYEQFKGVRPRGGWTIEMMGKQIPTAVNKRSGGVKSRRATLVFTKKSQERNYWKMVMSD